MTGILCSLRFAETRFVRDAIRSLRFSPPTVIASLHFLPTFDESYRAKIERLCQDRLSWLLKIWKRLTGAPLRNQKYCTRFGTRMFPNSVVLRWRTLYGVRLYPFTMRDSNKSGENLPVKTSETVFAIVEALKALDGARVTELANHLDLAKSTVHSHLRTLERLEYITREGDEYHLGLQFLGLGEFVRTRKELYRMTKEKVSQLAEDTEERAQFIVEEHGTGVYLHRENSSRAVSTDSGIGKRVYLHSTAAGKSILANLPEHTVNAIIERVGLPAVTEQTISDTASLFDELEIIREHGYAFNKEENVPTLNSVGVPIFGPDGRVLGALSVSGPSHRLQGKLLTETVPELLLGTANELELNLTYS